MRVAFADFVFDTDEHRLFHRGQPIHLGPKAFRLLEILIENRPRPMAKSALYERLWEGTIVEESNLAGLVNEVRAALGDRARNPRFIRTVHGFGYAFAGETGEARAFVIYQGHQMPLHEGANVLGRDATADVQIEHETVSRRHAVIHVASGGATIEDLSSKNGTFIDGARIEKQLPLREGQTITLGDVPVVYRTSAVRGSTVTIGG